MPWSAPVLLAPTNPAWGLKFSFAPSLALDGNRALAMVFFNAVEGVNDLGFDSSLATLRFGRIDAPALPVTRFVQSAIAAKRPQTAMSSRFPAAAPMPWRGANGQATLDVLELLQSPFEPQGANLVVYHRLALPRQ
jgi:hypothetical protein